MNWEAVSACIRRKEVFVEEAVAVDRAAIVTSISEPLCQRYLLTFTDLYATNTVDLWTDVKSCKTFEMIKWSIPV